MTVETSFQIAVPRRLPATRAPVLAWAVGLVLGLGLESSAQAQEEPEIGEYGDQFYTTSVGPNRVPPLGRTRVLVVPISFGRTIDSGYGSFLRFFDEVPGSGFSFTNYWRRQSNNRFEPVPTVIDVVEFDGCPVAGVEDCQFDVREVGRIGEVIELFQHIFDRIVADETISLADFDDSGQTPGVPDGWTDGILVIIPGWTGGVAPPVYPFLDVEEDGVKVGNVAIGRLDSELMLHEFGHNLGACDQYLWNFDHSLMSTCDTCSMDVHSRVALGWADVIDVPEGVELTYSLAPSIEGGSVLRFGTWPEYFLVERRAPFALGRWRGDAQVDGLVIVHVDMSLAKPALAQTNYPLWHPLLEVRHPTTRPNATVLVAGDEWRPDPGGDRAKTSEGNRPADSNWYDGGASGVGIRCVEKDRNRPGLARLLVRASGLGAWDPEVERPSCDEVPDAPNPDDPDDLGDPDEAAAGGGSTGDEGCQSGGGGAARLAGVLLRR